MLELATAQSGRRTTGVQSIGRALELLRIVAVQNSDGARLSDIVQASGLPKPTVYRLLSELQSSGMLMRDRQRRYRLGYFAHELGIIAANHFRVNELCRRAVTELADATGETIYVKVMSGKDVFCVDMEAPSKSFNTKLSFKGSRVSVGLGASGLALLSFLPESERRCLIADAAAKHGRNAQHHEAELSKKVEETRTAGYSCTQNDVIPGVSAVGIPILDMAGRPIVALSIAMASHRMSGGYTQRMLSQLDDKARGLRPVLIKDRVTALAYA